MSHHLHEREIFIHKTTLSLINTKQSGILYVSITPMYSMYIHFSSCKFSPLDQYIASPCYLAVQLNSCARNCNVLLIDLFSLQQTSHFCLPVPSVSWRTLSSVTHALDVLHNVCVNYLSCTFLLAPPPWKLKVWKEYINLSSKSWNMVLASSSWLNLATAPTFLTVIFLLSLKSTRKFDGGRKLC